MPELNRRAFLLRMGVSSAAFLGGGLFTACSSPPSRREVLAALVRDVVVPDAQALSKESARLKQSTQRFAGAPTASALSELQRQWKCTVLAWKRGYAFRAGPIVESNALLRTMFWPVRAREMDSLIESQRAIDAGLLDELGVDLKGLFAMEHLLFAPPRKGTSPLERFQGPGGARASEYAVALADDVDRYADSVMAGLADGSLFAQSFAERTEESLGLLVNQLVATVETVAAQRLQFTLDLLKSKRLAVDSVEGGKSGLSTQIVGTLLATTERFYVGVKGQGLAALTKQVSEPIHERVSTAFASARAAVEALDAPLEQVAAQNVKGLEAAAEATRELEISLKVDLASALGVLLTFSLGDGD